MLVIKQNQTPTRQAARRLGALSGLEVALCMQCGACAGACPLVGHMDHNPRQIMRQLQLGLGETLVGCRAPWVCATCDTCNVVCPRGLDVPRVMEALRVARLRAEPDAVHPGGFAREELSQSPTIALVAAFRKVTG
ncbi:MAG: 4Fe-4S dicluster domain-containing protein [Deltaproteobacteria bacterium]|nr:4Fe-4S dicluster domain-containing protein [Deltaproteobacteria bacterium]